MDKKIGQGDGRGVAGLTRSTEERVDNLEQIIKALVEAVQVLNDRQSEFNNKILEHLLKSGSPR